MSNPSAPVYRDPKVAVAVIIAENGRLLLQQRAMDPRRDFWTFSSGYVDRGEQVERAAEREVLEEFGLHVQLSHLLGVYSEPGNPVVLIVYLAEYPANMSEMIVQPEEIKATGWFAPDDLPPLAFAHDLTIIADWQAFVRDGQHVMPR